MKSIRVHLSFFSGRKEVKMKSVAVWFKVRIQDTSSGVVQGSLGVFHIPINPHPQKARHRGIMTQDASHS